MRRRYGRTFAAILLVALLAGIAGWAVYTQRGGAAPAQPAGRTDAPVRPATAAPAPVAAPSIVAQPLDETMARIQAQQNAGPDAGFQARRDTLERAAAAGDANAAAELGNLLLTCEDYVDFAAHDIEALLVEGIARFGTASLELPESVPLDALVDSTRHELERLRKVCDGASGLQLADGDRRRALDLLRQGARAGNTDAMANFGLYAFADFADRRAIIADPQTVRERKREAREYLERAIAAGNVEALWTAANAHHEGVFLEKSSFLAYANFYAYRQASTQGGVEPRVLEAELAMYAADLTPAQIADARRRGDAIYAACCRIEGGGS